jgi:hypothetical protein
MDVKKKEKKCTHGEILRGYLDWAKVRTVHRECNKIGKNKGKTE